MFDTFNIFSDTSNIAIQLMGKFPVDPKLEDRVAEARRRMKEEFNRPSLLDGGVFTRKNTILPQVSR